MAEQLQGTYYRHTGVHDYCGCEILPPPTYEIERIIIERVDFYREIRINGQNKQNAFIVTFAPNPYTSLKMCLNSGNAKRLAKQTWDVVLEDGTTCQGRIDLVKNFPVRLCRELTRDPSDGGQVYGLRISKFPAAALAEPTKKVITEDKVGVIVEWALKNGLDMAAIKAKYDFESQTVEDAVADGIAAKPQESDDLPE